MSAVLADVHPHTGKVGRKRYRPMKGRKRPQIDRCVEAAAFLMKAPRSLPQLREVMEPVHQDSVYGYVDAFQQQGLVYILEWRFTKFNTPFPVYAWQTKPFELPDAAKPSSPLARDSGHSPADGTVAA